MKRNNGSLVPIERIENRILFMPYAFPEHGALMSANILNSERAIDVSIMVIDAFVRLREIALPHTL
jgi:hypothetical protein